MNRFALRLATKATLLAGGAGPFPTMAAQFVYDSRRDDVSALVEDEYNPYIIVRTDGDTFNQISTSGRVMSRACELRLEIGVMSGMKEKDSDGNDQIVPAWPVTDMALEAFLDLLEYQALAALMGPTTWARWWVDKFGAQVWQSDPVYTDPSLGRQRLAQREIKITMSSFQSDQLPPMLRIGDPAYVPALPARVQEVFDYIDAKGGGDFKNICADLRNDLNGQLFPVEGRYPILKYVRTQMFTSTVSPPTGELPVAGIKADLLTKPDAP